MWRTVCSTWGKRCLVSLLLLLASCRKPAPPEQEKLVSPEVPSVTILAVGDILLARGIGSKMEKIGDFTLPFRSMNGELIGADITFGNLEGPFCPNPPFTESGMTFRVNPRGVRGLVSAGFDVVSVANNHFADGGAECMRFTLSELKSADVMPVGAGMSFDEAHAPAILARKGIRFAFLAYTYAGRNDMPGSAKPVIAGRSIERARRDVGAARKAADVVVVSLHDGAEYTRRIAPETRAFCRAVIDAGATAVFGHHPHVPQEVERYRAGWIFYSLGNFVFWQNHPPETRTGLAARLRFSGRDLEGVEALPLVIEPVSFPRLADPAESARILGPIGLPSTLLWRFADDRAGRRTAPAPGEEKARQPPSQAPIKAQAAQQ